HRGAHEVPGGGNEQRCRVRGIDHWSRARAAARGGRARGPYGQQARGRADERPLEDQAPEHEAARAEGGSTLRDVPEAHDHARAARPERDRRRALQSCDRRSIVSGELPERDPLADLVSRSIGARVPSVDVELLPAPEGVERKRLRFNTATGSSSAIFERVPRGETVEAQLLPFLARKTDRVPSVHSRGLPPPHASL